MRNNLFSVTSLLLLPLAVTFSTACSEKWDWEPLPDISLESYPRMDGSTSTYPLNLIIACKQLDIPYSWGKVENLALGTSIWAVAPDYQQLDENHKLFNEKVKASQTHQSILNLIDNKTDVVLSARPLSQSEQEYAIKKAVEVTAAPIALDALVFLKDKNNKVSSLTDEQIRRIYTGELTDWEEVNGETGTIIPLVRNDDSGSQELMNSLVMRGLEISGADTLRISNMGSAFSLLQPQGISYTVFYYKEMQVRDTSPNAVSLAVNGITPNKETIASRTYPYVAPVYALIRSDLDKSSIAYQMFEWLQSESGQQTIAEGGYVRIR